MVKPESNLFGLRQLLALAMPFVGGETSPDSSSSTFLPLRLLGNGHNWDSVCVERRNLLFLLLISRRVPTTKIEMLVV